MSFSRFLTFITLLFCTFSYGLVSAQPTEKNVIKAHIIGRVLNEQKKAVSYTTVALLRKNATVAGGALTEEDGTFDIEFSGSGTYSLKISGIGITTRSIENIELVTGSNKKMNDVIVFSSAKALKEVEITSERAMMEMSVDKKVFNVEKNITATGGSATDVLQNVPSVSVDVDGNISLRGKSNITVLIDGKPATLLGADVASALQSLPSASIQSVEVITNPSAKYDAQGMGGIVNIITKKDKKLGLNGSVTGGIGTRRKYNGGINLNLKNDKWNLFFNSNVRYNRNYHLTTTDRTNNYNVMSFRSIEDNNRINTGWFNTLGAEYLIDDKNSITLTENINFGQWGNEGTSDYNIYNAGQLTTVQRRTTDNLGTFPSSSTAVDFKHKYAKPRRELTANFTYAKTWAERTQELATYQYDDSENLLGPAIYQHAPGAGGNSSTNTQVDYTTPFLTPNGRLDAGAKSQMYWFESSNDPTVDSGGERQVDYLLLTKYNYTQQTHAAYTSFNNQGAKWGYQGGLRLEFAEYNGSITLPGDTSYTNDYLSLFPSAFVSYKLTDKQTVYFNSSRRTNRPNFWQMMPYLDLSNPQDTNQGNPDLVPEFIYNSEFNYNKQFKKGHNIIVSAYYQYTKNLIERYRLFYTDGTSYTRPENLNSGTTYGAELTGKLQLLPIWDLTANLNFFHNEINGTNIDPVLNNSGYSWFSKANTNVKLPKGFSLQLNANYESPKIAAQGVLQQVYWFDIAVRKNLWNGKANLVLNVSDILNTRKYTTIYNLEDYSQNTLRNRETRIGNLTFTYRFGKSEMKNTGGNGRKGGQQNGSITEKERNNLKTDESGQGGF